MRVVAIDNAAGRLAGGPDGAQAQWLRDVMDRRARAGIPSIVVGSVPLDGAQRMPPADDADEEIALLAGHASAYVATAGVDDPADPHFGGVLSQSDDLAPGAAARSRSSSPRRSATRPRGRRGRSRTTTTKPSSTARPAPRC